MSEELTVKEKQEMKEQLKQASLLSGCRLKVVGEGKDRHIEAVCKTKEDSHELAELLEKEVVIRVTPTAVIEETD